jgi:hypothetical protein
LVELLAAALSTFANLANVEALSSRHRAFHSNSNHNRKECAMNLKNNSRSKPKDAPLSEQYRNIGIPAVEAAARYQKQGDKAKSIGDSKQMSQGWRGTSSKR